MELVIYISLIIVGMVLLLFSLIGGVSHDVSHDIGGDAGGDFHGEFGGGGHDAGGMGHEVSADASGLSPVSLPMIATFLVVAGGTGAAFNVTGSDPLATALYSIIVGIIVFVGLFFLVVNFLVKAQASSTIHEKEYEGKTASVTETIPEDGIGAVAITVRGMRQVVSARSNGVRIPTGVEVLVRRVSESTAIVEELPHKAT
jgi:membrane-bound ClpP family serine protease